MNKIQAKVNSREENKLEIVLCKNNIYKYLTKHA